MLGFEPFGRFGVLAEIGEAAVWLYSDNASFVTGHAMVVDGVRLLAWSVSGSR